MAGESGEDAAGVSAEEIAPALVSEHEVELEGKAICQVVMEIDVRWAGARCDLGAMTSGERVTPGPCLNGRVLTALFHVEADVVGGW